MINQTALILTTAILQSLIAGSLCYTAYRLLLIVIRTTSSQIKYHLGNIALLVSFIAFIQPLFTLSGQIESAPIHSTTLPVTYEKTTQITPYVIQETTALTDPEITPEQVWQHIYSGIESNSKIIMLLYLSGLLLFSTRLLLQYLQSRRLKSTGTIPANEIWTNLLAKN